MSPFGIRRLTGITPTSNSDVPLGCVLPVLPTAYKSWEKTFESLPMEDAGDIPSALPSSEDIKWIVSETRCVNALGDWKMLSR